MRNCLFDTSYQRAIYDKVKGMYPAIEKISQKELFILNKETDQNTIEYQLNEDKVKGIEKVEKRLKSSNDFVAYGLEIGFVAVPVTSGELQWADMSDTIHFGDPKIFSAENAKKIERHFKATLSLKAANVVRLDEMRTNSLRFVPPYQTINEVEVPMRTDGDAMFQLEPQLVFQGNTDNVVTISTLKSVGESLLTGHNVHSFIRLRGYLIENVR